MSAQDSNFVKNFGIVLGVLAGIAVIFYIVASVVVGMSGIADPSKDPMMQAKIEQNLAPVGSVRVGDGSGAAAQPVAATGPRAGAEVYNSACMACHASGVAGAPKLGDAAAWMPRHAKGMDTLLGHVVNGFNAMPPKGTCADCSDDELRNAIVYMLGEAGIDAGGESAAEAAAEAAPAQVADAGKGRQVYDSACLACHASGAAGAPRLGDAAAWAPRIDKGMDTLLGHVINGFNAMPPKGTCFSCSDADLRAAVEYMIAESR